MRILFVASRFPWPLTHGDRLRAYHELHLLSRQHQIVLLSPQPDADVEENLRVIQPFCEKIELISTPRWKRLWNLGSGLFTSLPLQTLYSFDPRMGKVASRLLQEKPFDLVHVQLMRMAPVTENLHGVPTVIDFIDALSLNMARRAERERWFRTWLFALEARRSRIYEQVLLQKFDQAVVSTQQDRDALGSHQKIQVVPNGVDLSNDFGEAGRQPNVIALSGHMSYFPNADAALWFVKHVLPLVRQQIPNVQFWIVGADPPPAVQELAQQPGIVVTGRVDTLVSYLQQATIAVAPMRCGSGIQNKVLEAMSCGAALVVTPFALGGIEVGDEEHVLIGRDASEFADNVTRLLQDSTLRKRLAANARRMVEEEFAWEQSVVELERAYGQAMRNHAAYPLRREAFATVYG